MRRTDTLEVYPYKRKPKGAKRGSKAVIVGWKYRFFKAGTEEAMLVSDLVFDTRERAAEVAQKMNAWCFRGEYALKMVRA